MTSELRRFQQVLRQRALGHEPQPQAVATPVTMEIFPFAGMTVCDDCGQEISNAHQGHKNHCVGIKTS